jgi:hypothetical protein
VVLAPERVGLAGALHHAVGILELGELGLLGGHVTRDHPRGVRGPRRTGVDAAPDAPARDGHDDRARVAGIDADRVHRGLVGAAAVPAHPALVVPQRVDELPRLAAIVAVEKPAGARAAPQPALGGGVDLQRPDALQRPVALAAPHVDVDEAFGLGRVLRHADLAPRATLIVGAVELDAEVAVVQHRVPRAVARIGRRQRHVVADEVGTRDVRAIAGAVDHEQALAGRDMNQ